MSAFNSMSGAGSAIGITADIRLNRAELVSDIAAARQTIQTEFSSMQINFGASLLESVRSVTPEITASVAQAVAAGFAEGSGEGAVAGGAFNWGPLGPPASLGDSIDEDGPTVVGAATSVRAASAGGMGLGSAMFARMALTYGVFRLGRGEEEDFEQDVKSEERIGEAEGMPTGSTRQRERRAQSEFSAEQEKYNNSISFIKWFNDVATNPTGLALGPLTGGLSNIYEGTKQYYGELSGATSERDQAQTDLNYAKRDEDADNEKRLQLENQIIEARRRGNKAEEEHLQLLEQLTQRQQQMNEAIPGSGTAWFNTAGQAILGNDTANAIIQKTDSDAIKAMDFKTRMDILGKTASGDTRGAERETFQWQEQQKYMRAEQAFDLATHTMGANAGHDDYDFAAKVANDPAYSDEQRDAAREVISQKQLGAAGLKAFDATHGGGMAFTSGMETWRRMQTAGYGSAPGDNSGARRVYAAAGGSSAGNPLSLGSPSAPNWGSGLAHGGAGGGMISNSTIHGFDGMHATHPIGAGIGFAGFHPDMTHRMMEHNDTSGHRTTSEKSTGGIMGLIDKLNTKLDNAPKLAVVKISG